MKKLEYKIDFMGLISVTNANPNGDPLNGGRPRIDSNGYGMITDVCLKRKLRDRLMENRIEIYVSPPLFDTDTLDKRASAIPLISKRKFINLACKKWFDFLDISTIIIGILGCISTGRHNASSNFLVVLSQVCIKI